MPIDSSFLRNAPAPQTGPGEAIQRYLTMREMVDRRRQNEELRAHQQLQWRQAEEDRARKLSLIDLLQRNPKATREQILQTDPIGGMVHIKELDAQEKERRQAEEAQRRAEETAQKILTAKRGWQANLAGSLLQEKDPEKRQQLFNKYTPAMVATEMLTPEEAAEPLGDDGLLWQVVERGLGPEGMQNLRDKIAEAARKEAEEAHKVALRPAAKRTAEAGATKAEQEVTGTQPETQQQQRERWRQPGGLISILDDPNASAADKARAAAGLRRHEDLRRAGAPTTITPNQNISNESRLRDDYRQETKTYVTIRDAYNKIVSAAKSASAAGDIGLVYGFMRMQDPGSTVREGEFATAQNAGGIPERIRVMYNKAVSGERLDPNIRADFVKQAENIYGQSHADYEKTQDLYRGIAERGGMDWRNVVIDYSTAKPGAKAEPGTGTSAIPTVGGTFQGGKVLKVTKVK